MGDHMETTEIVISQERKYEENKNSKQDNHSTPEATEQNANKHFDKNENININEDAIINLEACKVFNDKNSNIEKNEFDHNITIKNIKDDDAFGEDCMLSPIESHEQNTILFHSINESKEDNDARSVFLSESLLQGESVVEFTQGNSTVSVSEDSVVEFTRDKSNVAEDSVGEFKQGNRNVVPQQDSDSDSETLSVENRNLCNTNQQSDKNELDTADSIMSHANQQMRVFRDLSSDSEEMLTSSTESPDSEIGREDLHLSSRESLLKMVTQLLNECDGLKRDKTIMEDEMDRIKADQSSDVYIAQLVSLEKTLAQAQADACSWKEKVQQTESKFTEENIKIRTDLLSRLERVTKNFEAAKKDKESMVMKYATSESQIISARKQKEAAEKKMKEMEKEKEQCISKMKTLTTERARICQTLDQRVQQHNLASREIERLKDDLNNRDVKIKWATNKLKTETDTQKETHEKLDRALTKITKHDDEIKSIKGEAEKIVRDTRENENSRANTLDAQLREEKAHLIMERQVKGDRDTTHKQVKTELETLQNKHKKLVEEATSLRLRVSVLEDERTESELLFTSLQAQVTGARQESADLHGQLSNSSHMQDQLTREREMVSQLNSERENMELSNKDMEIQVSSCRQKEAELLAFTQKLTEKNVQIQGQLSALESKAQLMELEQDEMRSELEQTKSSKAQIKAQLTKDGELKATQITNLTLQLKEYREQLTCMTTKASDFENEVQVLKRKNNNSIKDITREMQKLRRRLEAYENGEMLDGSANSHIGVGVSHSLASSQSATPHDSLSQNSRASSSSSLNNMSDYHTSNGTTPHQMQAEAPMPPLNDPLITQQLLVERIVKLQKSAAKRQEKIDFLEEHATQLVSELKKKSRIIHHYIMKEEAGALSNSASDSSKVEMMKHGGIMASVYGSTNRDSNMTMELSLEINRKLQAVLEDTLLKNITLKENLNTLGDEIAKISVQKH